MLGRAMAARPPRKYIQNSAYNFGGLPGPGERRLGGVLSTDLKPRSCSKRNLVVQTPGSASVWSEQSFAKFPKETGRKLPRLAGPIASRYRPVVAAFSRGRSVALRSRMPGAPSLRGLSRSVQWAETPLVRPRTERRETWSCRHRWESGSAFPRPRPQSLLHGAWGRLGVRLCICLGTGVTRDRSDLPPFSRPPRRWNVVPLGLVASPPSVLETDGAKLNRAGRRN